MINKIKSKPLWYQLWAVITGSAALYCLVKYFVYGFDSIDYLIQVFVLGSLLVDSFLFSSDKFDEKKLDQRKI